MNRKHIINNLRFEILKPYHNLSNFKSKSRKLNKYLKNQALEDQNQGNRITHLVIYDAQVIAFFSLLFYFKGFPEDKYDIIRDEIGDSYKIDELLFIEIRKFAMDKRFEDNIIACSILDNISFNIENIYKSNTHYNGAIIGIGDDCLFSDEFPPLEEFEEFFNSL